MNKIIRFASVIALACASLVYVGCTKDFSGDVNRLENQDQAITQQVQSLEKSLADFKTTAMNAIDANKAELGAKYDELKAAISGLQTTDANLDKAIGEVSASVNSALASIAKLETTDKNLQAQIDELAKAVEANKAACDAQVKVLKDELAQLLAAFGASSEEIEAVLARLDAENKYASSQIVELQEELQYQVSGILTELALQKSLLEAAASGVAANADAIKLNKEDIDALFGKTNANYTFFNEWCNTLAEEIWANHEEIEALFIKANATQADLDDFKNMIAEEIFRQSEEIETLFGKTAANYDFFSDWCEQIGAQASVNAEEIENLFAKVNALGQDLEDWKSQLAEQIGANMENIQTLFEKTNANYAYFSDWCEQLAGEVQSVKNDLDTLASKVLVENEGLATAIKTLKSETNAAINATNSKINTIFGSIEEINTKLDGVLASIVTIQKQIGGLQARITSIVAVPSVVPELTGYYIEGVLDTAIFTTTFLVNPIAAAEQLTAEDLTLYVKEGLAKGQTPIDEEYDVEVLSIKNGKVTVKAVVTNKLTPNQVAHKLYYALSFVGKDSADSTYEVVSRFEPAAYGHHVDLIETVELYNGTTKVTEALADSIKYNDLTTEVTAYPATLAPVYVLGDSLYTPDQLAAYFNLSDAAKAKVQFVDTNYVSYSQGQTATKDAAQSFIVDTTAAKVKVAAAHGTAVGNVVEFYKKYVIAGMAEGTTLDAAVTAQSLASTVKISPIEYTITLPTLTTKWTWKADTTYTTSFVGTDAASIAKLIAGSVAVDFDSTWFSVNTTVKPDSIILAAANPYIVNAAKTAAVQAKPVADSVAFIINGEVVLPVQPADITVNLGSCDTVVTDFTQTIIIPNDNFGLFYAEIADKIEIAQADTADFWAVVDGNFPASTSTVKYNEESVSGTSYIHFGLGQIIVKDDVLANGYGTYVLTRETEVNGVKITFNYTINVKQADVALTVVDPYVKVKNGVNYIEVKGNKTSSTYKLNVLPMNTYFRVEGEDVAETSALPYTISYVFPEEFTTTLGAPCKYEYDPNGKMISDHELDFTGYQNDTLVVKTYLNNNIGMAVDSLELVFWTKDPIPTFVSTYRTIKVKTDGQPTTEYLFSTQSDPSTADLLFTPIYALDLDGKFVNFNDNIFEANLIFGPKETWTVNGEPVPATILDLITLDEVNGKVTVAANQATWEKPIVISVPVALGYTLGGLKEGSVQLRISK